LNVRVGEARREPLDLYNP